MLFWKSTECTYIYFDLQGSGLTHKSKVVKTQCAFQWTAPAIDYGDINFQ